MTLPGFSGVSASANSWAGAVTTSAVAMLSVLGDRHGGQLCSLSAGLPTTGLFTGLFFYNTVHVMISINLTIIVTSTYSTYYILQFVCLPFLFPVLNESMSPHGSFGTAVLLQGLPALLEGTVMKAQQDLRSSTVYFYC